MPAKKTRKTPAATKTAKKAVARKTKKNGSSSKKREVRVRMYKQGLGDCFLLTFPRKPEPFHMLVDCGALKSKHYGDDEMNAAVGNIQQTIRKEAAKRKKTNPAKLDVVACTHEHWDHISGFHQAKDIFDSLNVDKVWVAWTEEPDNAAAKQLKKEFKKKKKAVEKAMALIPEDKKDERLGLYRHAISELFGFFGGLGANAPAAGGTEATWDYMLGLGENEFCDPKKQPLKIEGVDNVRVYILGPPEDPDYIRKKLSKTETYDEGKHGFSLFDSFMAAVNDDNDFPDAKARARPFDESYSVTPDVARHPDCCEGFFNKHYGFSEGEDEWRRIDYDWLNMAGELALHLDSYTNNTCLAFAVELGEPGEGKVLLFPGDAQVGNWLSWGDLEWNVKDSDGKTKKVTAAELLARTVLYKVGHHGSHNATLRKKGLEMMTSPDLVAMIPVHRPTADDQKWEFPYPPLWNALKKKARGRVLLADAADLSEIQPDVKKSLTSTELQRFQKATKFDDLYVEYRIPY